MLKHGVKVRNPETSVRSRPYSLWSDDWWSVGKAASSQGLLFRAIKKVKQECLLLLIVGEIQIEKDCFVLVFPFTPPCFWQLELAFAG